MKNRQIEQRKHVLEIVKINLGNTLELWILYKDLAWLEILLPLDKTHFREKARGERQACRLDLGRGLF
jgi:hypothetical protein